MQRQGKDKDKDKCMGKGKDKDKGRSDRKVPGAKAPFGGGSLCLG